MTEKKELPVPDFVNIQMAKDWLMAQTLNGSPLTSFTMNDGVKINIEDLSDQETCVSTFCLYYRWTPKKIEEEL